MSVATRATGSHIIAYISGLHLGLGTAPAEINMQSRKYIRDIEPPLRRQNLLPEVDAVFAGAAVLRTNRTCARAK